MKSKKLSKKGGGGKIGKGTVVVEAGLPKDRLRGYREHKTGFTGSDARAALVGAYKGKK